MNAKREFDHPGRMKRIYSWLLCIAGLLLVPVSAVLSQPPSNIDNPVLPGVADAGVIKYNGEYYIGGVFTNGSFYKSRDLVKWEGPVHVFSMDNAWTHGPSAADSQIHANDINYINGVFHQYWSVNYWGKDQHVVHIGHATATDVLGPYSEPVKDTWLDNRIDPELFVDDDGTPYLYMVKFTDGNTIWVRPMKDPSTFSAAPTYLFSSMPRTWETLDNRVAEGPWVIKYRNRYYLMYNANHTSPQWGNYMLGVAEADSPLGFNHGNKYPAPVVVSNQLQLEDEFSDVLKYSVTERDTFFYTFEPPAKDWNEPEFDASAWKRGKGGFGSAIIKNSTTRKVGTLWNTPAIWLRKSFVRNEGTGNMMLRIHHDGEASVFLNGELLYRHEGRQYTTWNFDQRARALLRDGRNVLAIHSTRGPRSAFFDVSLFDMKDKTGDDILFSPGQPNILRGPNGFEWWLVYMANKNAERRGQYINRIHFFDKKLFADAITGTGTPGHHPPPAPPTFSDLFDEGDRGRWQREWNARGGIWETGNGELVQKSDDTGRAFVKSRDATHYLFEAGLKMSAGTRKAGIYAWWQDEDNCMKIVLDQERKTWAYVLTAEGDSEVVSFALPGDFNYHVYHTIRVYKNAANFIIEIDGLPAPGDPVVEATACSGSGVPGLYSEGTDVRFDGVLYTIGWDECDDAITGWLSPSKSGDENSSFSVSERGLLLQETHGENRVFKGDLLEEYEISAQITTEDTKGSAGIYPVFNDANNYLSAVFDLADQQLVVSGKKNGKAVEAAEVPLQRSTTCYADMRFTDFIEKHFRFDTPTYINGLDFYKTPHDDADTLIEDLYKRLDIFYRRDGKWYPLTDYREAASPHPGFDKIIFEPVLAEGLKFVNREADDHRFYVYKVRVNELFRQSYNLRVARYRDQIIYFVDGKEVLRSDHRFPASRVGLVTEDAKANFNGINLFHINRKVAP